MASNDNGGNFITGFILGGLIGAIVGILMAPKAGSETRADLLVQSETLRRRTEELAAQAREQIGPAVESVRERVGPAVERVATRARRGARTSGSDGDPGTEAAEGGMGGPEAEKEA